MSLLSRKLGWEYLHCLCENTTQADNVIAVRKPEGWLLKTIDVTRKEYIEVIFNRRIFHSPGWYVITCYGIHQDEEGPFRTEELARKAANIAYTVSVKYYDIERSWEPGDRFSNLAGRFKV